MSGVKDVDLTPDYVAGLVERHAWAAGGVSDYPPRDPLVGQSRFFRAYKNFIHMVDTERERFAHVFAVEGEWGRGKSRLGHELIAQINDCSRGWFVRDDSGQMANAALNDAKLFDSPERRDAYLGLYIRYSQLASDVQSSDNWFSFGLYKVLLPLATRVFDGSIQSRIAQQALRRLEPEGFDSKQLAKLLEVEAEHSDETLYLDPTLATRLVQQAYQYLRTFGIRYVLIVLDELETVAEAATFGLEADEQKHLDGQAIRLIGKAIKEEDPRAKLPWLRYVALCSPLLGQQLREIKSLARRFELAELETNAFADVSDYVAQLKQARKLAFDYPRGLVEAAYAMSGANFGWFNVIMANVDAVLGQMPEATRGSLETGEIISAVLASSGRVATHVLDHNAIEGIDTKDQALLALARRLLFGQLPISRADCPPRIPELLKHRNEYSEPVASHYVRVQWDRLDCRRALEDAKFLRERDLWFYPGVEQGLNLNALLANLRTFAIVESGPNTYLIPTTAAEFKHLVGLVHNHPASELAADALWRKHIGTDPELPLDEATHIGPSVAMLLRLDLRYRRAQHNSMIFRDPAMADAHEQAMAAFETACRGDPALRARVRLTGLMRLLDRNWQYAEEAYPNTEKLIIQASPRARGRGGKGGLLMWEGLKLHPDGLAWLAWVSNQDDLVRLHAMARSTAKEGAGRFPVVAFTGSLGVVDYYDKGGFDDPATAGKNDILLYYLNSSELDTMERIGLTADLAPDLGLRDDSFTSRFKTRLNGIRDFAHRAVDHWRSELDRRGLIAWPLRPEGKLNQDDRDLLFRAWKLFALDEPKLGGLHALTPNHGIDAQALAHLFGRLALSGTRIAQGFGKDEHSGLFVDLDDPAHARARFPAFLTRVANPGKTLDWTLDKARADWYWGHLAAVPGLSTKSVFDDWMWWCAKLHLLKPEDASAKTARWIQVQRAEIANALKEAENWLDCDDTDGYRATVKRLEQVFGSDQIPGKFAPKGAQTQGIYTVEAFEQLDSARSELGALTAGEEALTELNALDLVRERIAGLVRSRCEALALIERVRPANPQAVGADTPRMLLLDDRSQSLFERVAHARRFADVVARSSKMIRDTLARRIAAIDEDPDTQPPFPRRLFTLSLETVGNILSGALEATTDSETQKAESTAGSDTLRHFLRALELEKASERLELLAGEAGVDLRSGLDRPFDEVQGHILHTYRQFKERYKTASDQAEDVAQRIAKAQSQLDPLPSDYPEQGHPTLLVQLEEQQKQLIDSFSDLQEQVDEQRARLRLAARKGQFGAMRDMPDLLLKPILTSSAVLGGKVLNIENAISAYRNERSDAVNKGIRRTLGPLFKALGQEPVEPLQPESLSELSLHDFNVTLDQWRDALVGRAESALHGTGVSLDRWNAIAAVILAGESPGLSQQEQQGLVERGILRLRIGFGGAA